MLFQLEFAGGRVADSRLLTDTVQCRDGKPSDLFPNYVDSALRQWTSQILSPYKLMCVLRFELRDDVVDTVYRVDRRANPKLIFIKVEGKPIADEDGEAKLSEAVLASAGLGESRGSSRSEPSIGETLFGALELFRFDVGHYPTTEEGLAALCRDAGIKGWHGPYSPVQVCEALDGFEYRRQGETFTLQEKGQ